MKRLCLFIAAAFVYSLAANAQNDPTSDDWTTGTYTHTSNRVGIGTSSPAFELQIRGLGIQTFEVQSDDNQVTWSLDNTGSNAKTIRYRVNGATKGGIQMPGGTEELRFQTGGVTDRMTIKASGDVGIGTTAPSTLLDVAGIITATGGTSSDWNTAFGWGNHAIAGYLTTESDPQVGTNTNSYIPRWNGAALVTGSVQDDGSTIGIGTAPITGKKVIISSIGWQDQLRVERGTEWIDINPNTGLAASVIQASKHLALAADDDLDKVLTLRGGKVGVGVGYSHTPISTMEVEGNFAVGSGYIGTAAPTNGAIIEGNVGIGTSSPTGGYRLHIDGGDLRIDDSFAFLELNGSTNNSGIRFLEAGSGVGYIWWDASSNKLRIASTSGGTGDHINVMPDGKIGMGIAVPTARLHVEGSAETHGLRVDHDYTGTSTKYGIYNQTDAGGTGVRYGFYNDTDGNGADPSTVYGNYNVTTSNGSAANVYGVYSTVSTTGTGSRYALYGFASTTEPSASTKSWALYASGNSYFSQDVRMGYTNDVPGYKLAVNGNVICEELKVQDSGDWPDYVFDKDYKLLTLDQVEDYIKSNNHLPGVPSAECVEQDGISVAEMTKTMMEKIEELTLHMIEQSKQIKALQDENHELRSAITK